MSYTFYSFLAICFGCILFLVYLLRGILPQIMQSAALHAKENTSDYVKCLALVCVAVILSFKETFHAITIDAASNYQWWDWVIAFLTPIAAGLNTLIAFLHVNKTKIP